MASAVIGIALRIAWYRFRMQLRSRWRGYVGLVAMIGLTAGVAMCAAATGRATSSSFDEAARKVNESDLFMLTRVFNPSAGVNTGYDARLVARIDHLPHVKHGETLLGINAGPLGTDGLPLPASDGVAPVGSLDGELFDQDRVIIERGRMAKPDRVNEFVIDAKTARAFGEHLGQVVTFGAYSNAQTLQPPGPGGKPPAPSRRFTATLVGIVGPQPRSIVHDDVDAGNDSLVLFTPALTRQLLSCCVDQTENGLQVVRGARESAQVAAQVAALASKGLPSAALQLNAIRATSDRALRPTVIALGVFGLIAGLAAVLIAGQMISRNIRRDGDDLAVLRDLGADPTTALLACLVGVIIAILAGALLAVLVAIALSPVAPVGPFRRFDASGIHADWTVVGIGGAALVVILCGVAVVAAYLNAPHRAARRAVRRPPRASVLARRAAAAGLPVSACTGIRFALEPGGGRTAVPVRSAMLAATLATVLLVTTIVFGTSLRTLVDHPALYGWSWDLEMNGGGGLGDIPAHRAAQLLAADDDVAAWSGYYFSTLQIDGRSVPVLGGEAQATVAPPLLSGHGLDRAEDIVLGVATLKQLHKHLGDTVGVGAVGSTVTRLHIVGTATLPAIGVGGATHLEMGTGAVVAYTLIPPAARNVYDLPQPGPNAILVRLRTGVSERAGARSLSSIVVALGGKVNGGTVIPVQRPAEITNYRALGSSPTLLSAALNAAALAGLALTLVATVRRRRRDLAILKAIGFTGRQLAAAFAWQASIVAAFGICTGSRSASHSAEYFGIGSRGRSTP